MGIFKGTFAGAMDSLREGKHVARRAWDEDYGYLEFVAEVPETGAQAHVVRITPDGKRHSWPAETVLSLPITFTADVILAHDYYVVEDESEPKD
jgi:hypothetical protein